MISQILFEKPLCQSLIIDRHTFLVIKIERKQICKNLFIQQILFKHQTSVYDRWQEYSCE